MAARRNRIPEKDSEFDQYLKNSTVYLLQGTSPVNWERLGLEQAEMDAREEYKDNWETLYGQWGNVNTRTKTVTDNKNKLIDDFRTFNEPLLTPFPNLQQSCLTH